MKEKELNRLAKRVNREERVLIELSAREAGMADACIEDDSVTLFVEGVANMKFSGRLESIWVREYLRSYRFNREMLEADNAESK